MSGTGGRDYIKIADREPDDVFFKYCIRCKKNRSDNGMCKECQGPILKRVGREPCYQDGCHKMRVHGSVGCKQHWYAIKNNKLNAGGPEVGYSRRLARLSKENQSTSEDTQDHQTS